jgi:glyoxylase-like metal-dependent hydrolase (beta-lactamase superfamily II)
LLSLEAIKRLDPKIIVPGHGEILSDHRINTEIKRTESILNMAIKNGLAPTE